MSRLDHFFAHSVFGSTPPKCSHEASLQKCPVEVLAGFGATANDGDILNGVLGTPLFSCYKAALF